MTAGICLLLLLLRQHCCAGTALHTIALESPAQSSTTQQQDTFSRSKAVDDPTGHRATWKRSLQQSFTTDILIVDSSEGSMDRRQKVQQLTAKKHPQAYGVDGGTLHEESYHYTPSDPNVIQNQNADRR